MPHAVLFAALGAAMAEPVPDVTLARLEARLFYMESGRLSEDLIGRARPFDGWNTISGEGDAEDFLTSDRGVVVLPLWLSDATCAGELAIEGRFQGTVKRAKLHLECGE